MPRELFAGIDHINMRRTFLLLALISTLFLSSVSSFAQSSVPIRSGPNLPSTCTPNAKRTLLYYKTGASNGLYQCLSANTWTANSSGVGSLNFGGNPSNVNHGAFWSVDTEYQDSYWSAWVKPVYPSLTGYYISDGSGGQHNVLNGVTTSTSTFTFTGNVYDGQNAELWTMASIDSPPLGEWVHYEVIHDHPSNLYVLLNGVCTFYGKTTQGGVWTSSFTGTRSFLAGGSDGVLYVGGSFHNNFPGYVKAVRGVEGSNAGITVENRYVPRDYSGYISNGLAETRASFSADYSVSGTRSFIDMGVGFEDRIHHGAFSRYSAADPYPQWVSGEVTPSTYVPTAPSTPVGALVFDSFSRVNNLELFDNAGSLGTTEAGSLGAKTWVTSYFDASNRGGGILYGRAVIYASQISTARVLTDRTDVDIRVTRPTQPWASTGIVARYKDSDNYYIIRGSDTSIDFEFKEAGSQTFPAAFTVTTGWEILRVVMNGTTMTVYVDGTEAGTKTVVNDAGALYHGIATAGNVARYDNFTIFAAP